MATIAQRQSDGWASQGDATRRSTWRQRLQSTADITLIGVLFGAPFFLGGRHDVGRLVYVSLIALAATASFASRQSKLSLARIPGTAYCILLSAVALLAVQIVPLPASWIAVLSPRTQELLPVWSDSADPAYLGAWSTLSLTPGATRLSLAMLVAYGLLFLTVASRIRSNDDLERLLRWIGISAGAIALFGLVQWFVSNGKFVWVYQHPSRSTDYRLSGPFDNRNHFAHLLVLGASSLLAWFITATTRSSGDQSASRSGRPNDAPSGFFTAEKAIGLLLLICIAAAVISCSRGGAIALLIVLGVNALVLWRAAAIQSRQLAAMMAVGTAVVLCVSFVGYDRMTARLATLTAASLDELDGSGGRRKIWNANLEAIRQGGWFGSGAGSHREIYRTYLSDPPQQTYTHAENGYLQIVTENGLAGGLLLLTAIGLVGTWSLKALLTAPNSRQLVVRGAIVAGLAASAVHSLFDFVWYIPACLCPGIMLAACVMRACQLDAETGQKLARVQTGAVGIRWNGLLTPVVIALAALFSVSQLIPAASSAIHWDEYLRVARADRHLREQMITGMPAYAAESVGDGAVAREASLESMTRLLARIIRIRPDFAPAHRHMATRLSQLFEFRQARSPNPMPVSQIRDAALASDFDSSAELKEWLDRAVGDNAALLYRAYKHARASVTLSPLQGDSFVRLADLCFLHGQGIEVVNSYLAQATTVRPYDSDMLVDVGKQYIGRGMVEKAVDAWTRAFRIEGPHRITIARHMAAHWPLQNFLVMFEPEWDSLYEVWRVAQPRATPDAVAALLEYGAELAKANELEREPAESAENWRLLAKIQAEAGDLPTSVQSLHRAVQLDPASFDGRRALGQSLNRIGRFEEADRHLRWCLARRPNDRAVERELKLPFDKRTAAFAANSSAVDQTEAPAGSLSISNADSLPATDNPPDTTAPTTEYR